MDKIKKGSGIDILFCQPVANEGWWIFSNSLLQLASFIYQQGFDVKVIHLGVAGDYKKKLLESLKKYNPRYVCVGLRYYTTLYIALETIRLVKKINREIITITGGYTATYFDKELLMACPSLDIIVKGDGEVPLLNILENKELINCTFREDEHTINQNPITYTQKEADLRGLHLVNLNKIVESITEIRLLQKKQMGPLYPRAFVWCGKGCNYNCIYCGARHHSQERLFNRKYPIFRNVEDVVKDIKELSNVGFNTFEFDFDPFAEDKEFYLCLFNKIKGNKFNVVFNSWTLPSNHFLESLHNSFNKVLVTISPETFCESNRKYLYENGLGRPYYSNKELIKCMEDISGYDNLYLELYLVGGLPLETDISFKRNLEFAKFIMKRFPSIFNKMSGYRPINYLPLQIEPSTFLDEPSRQFITQHGMKIVRKDFNDFYEYSRKAFFFLPRNPFGLDPASTYRIQRNVNNFRRLFDKKGWKEGILSVRQTLSEKWKRAVNRI